jgi:hypothetical protein
MKSPFPGMDPYLEPHWLDVHTRLTTHAAEALNESLPPDLIASTEERVAIESETGDDHVISPDVQIVSLPSNEVLATEEDVLPDSPIRAPIRLLARVEPATERYIRIIEAGTERLITVIEFVSPANKRQPGLRAFRAKRSELLASGVNCIEVDLVRAGDWRALLAPHRAGRKSTATYRVTLRSPRDLGAVYLHPVPLQNRLPEIQVPLRQGDKDTPLDLQPLIERVYSAGRYERRLDYGQPLDPPLDDEDAAWVAQILTAAGKR